MVLKDLLKKISETAGISGFEGNVREILQEEFRQRADEVWQDNLGNLIALKKGTEDPGNRVMLAAHMDEIGLLVSGLEDNGFLRFTSARSFDIRILPGQEVTIAGTEPIKGIIGCRPPALQTPEEAEKVVPVEELFIDTGLPQVEVERKIKVGDAISIRREAVLLGKNFLAGKALDDRASVVVLLGVLESLQKVKHDWHVYAVATVQEEVGLRGARVSTYQIAPKVAVAIDVTQGDMAGSSEESVFPLGKGPTIGVGPNIHPRLQELLVQVAKDYEIPYQIEPCGGLTGTDARVIQVSREGVPTVLVSIPLRYMHSSVEVVHLSDIERAIKLIAAFISRLDDHPEWKQKEIIFPKRGGK